MTEPAAESSTERLFDAVIVGAGFSGMYQLHRLRALGLSVRVLEQGGDIGGTWYWNRYPGARCDIPTIEYSFSFDKTLEQSWDWHELMAGQPEILDYANHFAERFDLRRDIDFDTEVTAAAFDENRADWRITTADGAVTRARYLIMATGCLSVPHWADIPGRDEFAGPVFHTGLWPAAGVDHRSQRVGIIGAGSSAVQAIPVIAETAAQVLSFQRTPVYSMPANNHPLDDAFRADIKARYDSIRAAQRASMAGFVLYGVQGKVQDMGAANILDLSVEERRARLDAEGLASLRRYPDVAVDLTANETACDLFREEIASLVEDPDTASALMPRGYPLGCKRQVVDTNYYETFNRPHVEAIDLRAEPIERITATGIRTSRADYEFDQLIFATGFDAMTGALTRVDIRGRGNRALREHWEAGPRSYLGLQAHGFPNLFTVTGPGSPSVLSNMLVSIEQHCDWITDCIAAMRDNGHALIEPERAAEDAWVEHVNAVAQGTVLTAPSCNSWYLGANIPGKTRLFMPYIGGVGAYREKCAAVVANGYEGFRFA
ncbi:MAG: NAD(P)/FAD-dependent oxidoreductase [Pseudomonadota bacterium]